MLSKGKKVRYSCPECGSGNIEPIVYLRQQSGECHDCNTWWPWRTRTKVSIKNETTINCS